MKHEFERSVRNMLENSTLSELGLSYDKASVWQQVIAKKKHKTVWLRPLLTHVAAVLIGVLLAGSIILLIFKHQPAPYSIPAGKKVVSKGRPVKQHPYLINKTEAKKTSGTVVAVLNNKTAEASSVPSHKKTGTETGNKHLKHDVVLQKKTEKALVSNPVLRKEDRPVEDAVSEEKTIVYWADIKPAYTHPDEPKVWNKMARKFRDLNDDELTPSADQEAPIAAFLKVFK